MSGILMENPSEKPIDFETSEPESTKRLTDFQVEDSFLSSLCTSPGCALIFKQPRHHQKNNHIGWLCKQHIMKDMYTLQYIFFKLLQQQRMKLSDAHKTRGSLLWEEVGVDG